MLHERGDEGENEKLCPTPSHAVLKNIANRLEIGYPPREGWVGNNATGKGEGIIKSISGGGSSGGACSGVLLQCATMEYDC